MNLALFAYSRQGCITGRKIVSCLEADQVRCYTMERFSGEGFLPFPKDTHALYGTLFSWADFLIFVGACGIAVRKIAPHVRDKRTDPGVVCVDELGRFVIPLLSGHIGGANRLSSEIARKLNAVAVITTATDIHQKFSVDAWAVEHGFVIGSMALAKAVSAAILERDIPLFSDFPVVPPYPGGIVPGQNGELGIFLSYRTENPFSRTLHLIPRILHLGIGCRRGTSADAIARAVAAVFAQHALDTRAIGQVASIDLKQDEAGLLQYCKDLGVAPVFYSAQQLLEIPGEFTVSPFVQSVTGVDCVCERAAKMQADTLIVHKTVMDGVTVAVGAEELEVHFG